MKHYRTVESLKKKLDLMVKNNPKGFTVEHGVGCYGYHHYEYEAPCCSNRWEARLDIYVEDFWNNNRPMLYMTLTDDVLARITDEWDWTEHVSAYWEKEFPTIIVIREYSRY